MRRPIAAGCAGSQAKTGASPERFRWRSGRPLSCSNGLFRLSSLEHQRERAAALTPGAGEPSLFKSSFENTARPFPFEAKGGRGKANHIGANGIVVPILNETGQVSREDVARVFRDVQGQPEFDVAGVERSPPMPLQFG